MSDDRPQAFVMADIAGSSRLWNREHDAMSAALARHDAIAAAAVTAQAGDLFKHTGDGFIARFESVAAALAAMDAYVAALAIEEWPAPVQLRSRVGVHWGPAEGRSGDWFGSTVNHLARMTDLVEPGHVVASEAAAAACEPLVARLLEPLGAFTVRDVPGPLMLHALVSESAVGPALTTEAGRSLPTPATDLVGRVDDIAALLDRVAQHRLTTIVGFGGTGKTRLAIEVAQRRVEGAGGTAHFVDLTSDDEPMLALAEAIGLPASKLDVDGSPYPVIARHLAGRSTVLVVDNCEHVIDAAADMCEALVAASPTTSILATSREPLELPGEVVHTLAALSADAAVELLEERAALAGVATLDRSTADRLVDAVDRLPLGIELVVARLRQMDALALADALEEDLDALQSRRRRRGAAADRAGGRHATLRSVIEWSVRLLDDDERTLLYRLSRLPAVWTRDTAAKLTPELAPDLVEELVAKSLVSMDREGGLRMLESVRQFCDGELRGPALADADHALIEWALAEAPPVVSVAGLVFDNVRTRQLREASANFRAALAACVRLERHNDRAALLTGLWPLVVDARSRVWFDDEVAAAMEGDIDPDAREILIRLSFQGQVGEHIDAARRLELVEMLESIDHDGTRPVWSMIRANDAVAEALTVRMLGGDQQAVQARLQEIITVSSATDHALDEAIARLYLSFSFLLDGSLDEARAESARCAQAAGRCQFVPLVGLAEASVALSALLAGDSEVALDAATAALPLGATARWESSIRVVAALALQRSGNVDDARRAMTELIDLAIEQGNPFMVFDAVAGLAGYHVNDRRLDEARSTLAHSSLTRTPLAFAALLHAAGAAEFDLGIDRFLDSFDAQKIARRRDDALVHLAAERSLLAA